MSHLNTILDLISKLDNTATMSDLLEHLELNSTQITEAIRPAINSGDVTKTGRGKTSVFTIVTPEEENLTETDAPTREEVLDEEGITEEELAKQVAEAAEIANANKPKDERVTTLKALCETLDIAPATARRKLRKSVVSKPVKGWEWAEGVCVKNIIAIISK